MKAKKLICTVLAALALCCFAACGKEEQEEGVHACADNLVMVPPVDSTCLVQGHKAYYRCTVCEKIYSNREASTPLTEDAMLKDPIPHELKLTVETVGNYTCFYYCSSCGHYFSDANGKTEIPYADLQDGSVTPIKLNEVATGNILVTKSCVAESEFEDINEDFTFRCFLGWSKEGATFEEFEEGQVSLYLNLNRIETLSGGQNWYNCGIGYDAERGLCFKDFESGALEKVSSDLSVLFKEQGGIYVRLVRKGTKVSLYLEDKHGMPRFITDNDHFGISSPLVRLAANDPAPGVTAQLGWTPFVRKTAICLGIANARCVFDD